ncbi:MAG: class I SAM-dependent methyltransferase, partial [Gemmatimonadaceae bacterium]|nr:class I SAM-dependent methyltransferase [Gemmatimonadaceae bacterium]
MKESIIRLVADAARMLRRGSRGARFDATRYWEQRYAAGGTSGDGSYGLLAEFKADVVNGFVREHDVRSAIEFGCGDGNQLSLMRYPAYVGLDVSASAVERCINRFRDDRTKTFFIYDPEAFEDPLHMFRADLALSLDVIYHIVADRMFERYMKHLCDSASRYLIVYSTDVDKVESQHVRHRSFTNWMTANRPEFHRERVIPNPYPGT